MEATLICKMWCVLMVSLCILPEAALSLPAKTDTADSETSSTNEERRATWLETRNTEENFKELFYLTLQELVKEGLVNPDALLHKPQEKRGRHQGFCFKKTKSGRFLPYICWKEGDADE